MIDLPIGKAITAVERSFNCNQKCMVDDDYHCPIMDKCCDGCMLKAEELGGSQDSTTCGAFCCIPNNRKDKKMVKYMLVDYPEKK